MTHDQLASHLADHLCSLSDRMVWTDMQLGPVGSPRPDVYTLNKSFAHVRGLAYECKISRADFRSDVTSGKWQNYYLFACGVIFVAPSGLLKREDIPVGCGLMTYNVSDGRWATLKAPMLREMPECGTDFWMKLLMDGVEREHRQKRRVRQPASPGR